MGGRLGRLNNSEKNSWTGAMLALLVLSALLLASEARCAVITVGKSGDPAALSSISEALEKVSPGDVIEAHPDIYNGNLAIKTPCITVRGIDFPVIQGEKTGNAVTVTAPNVTITGFVVRGGGREPLSDDAGIKLIKVKECVVTDNRLEDNLHGIYLNGSEKCVVSRNTIRGRAYDYQEDRGNGIHLHDSPFNRVEHNDISETRDGVYISFSNNCALDYNKVYKTRYGLHYMYSHDNSFSYNTLIDNVAGAAVMYARNMKFNGNVSAHNRSARAYGILWQDVRHSECFDNLIFDNTIGLYLDHAGFSKIYRNGIISNDVAITVLENSEDNYIYSNNFVNNLSALRLRGRAQKGHNNLFYYDQKGNYWSDYRGYDLDGDGVGDVSFKLQGVWDYLEAEYPEFRLFFFSPLTTGLDMAERAFPIIETAVTAEDKFPLLRPAPIQGPPKETIAKTHIHKPEILERLGVAFASLALVCGALVAIRKGIAVS
jgi:nitrous oxidase accessory protein